MPGLTVASKRWRLAVQARMAGWSNLFAPIRADGALQRRTDTLIAEFALTDRGATLANNLAYGDQRRLEVAMAMAIQPQLLLLDEPTAGMSMSDSADFVAWARALPRSITLLVIEHDMDVVFELADRITVLHYGQIIADGTPDEVRANPRVMEVYLGEKPVGVVADHSALDADHA
ncbi:MAG: ATP-binding cassette domain-containing protein [Caldilineaceae bacterium]|nr:ATP-binding cassette domain-containing protein [Caldilineaceae bacterium]